MEAEVLDSDIESISDCLNFFLTPPKMKKTWWNLFFSIPTMKTTDLPQQYCNSPPSLHSWCLFVRSDVWNFRDESSCFYNKRKVLSQGDPESENGCWKATKQYAMFTVMKQWDSPTGPPFFEMAKIKISLIFCARVRRTAMSTIFSLNLLVLFKSM